MTSRIVLALLAASCFTGGALLMKPAAGLSRLWPTLGVFGLFVVGAAINVVLVRIGDAVGPAALAVIGAETVLAVVVSAIVFGERLTPTRLAALSLVLIGVVILSAEQPSAPTGDEPFTAASGTPAVAVVDAYAAAGPAPAAMVEP
jgi:multidrug transporter EmrE-like cation transporter